MAERRTDFLFREALDEHLARFDGRVIVEIGSIRDPRTVAAGTDGHSTLAWARSGLPTWSVDISERATEITRQMVADYRNVTCITMGGIEFLQMFDLPIDLLYLDGPDPVRQHGEHWAVDAFRVAGLSERAVLLIDDVDLPNRGKGRYVIPEAERSGFRLVECGRQALLVRE